MKIIRHKSLYMSVLTIVFTFGLNVTLDSATHGETVKREPLRVLIRPRSRIIEHRPLIDPEILRKINDEPLKYDWDVILNQRFISGYQDDKSLKKFGYSINSEIGSRLNEKYKQTNDPENLLRLNEYKNDQLYSEASPTFLSLAAEIRNGCQQQTQDKCGYNKYGQHWLKYNATKIDISRGRSDDFLVNLLRSLE